MPFPVVVLQHPDGRNHGRAATRNLALPNLMGDVVMLLDSDMRLVPDAIDEHVRLLERLDCVSVGDVVYTNADENLWARYLATRGRKKRSAGSVIRPLDFVTANSAMRTKHLLAVGGFDETLAGYGGEDTELALRLAARGLSFVFNASARRRRWSSKDDGRGPRGAAPIRGHQLEDYPCAPSRSACAFLARSPGVTVASRPVDANGAQPDLGLVVDLAMWSRHSRYSDGS